MVRACPCGSCQRIAEVPVEETTISPVLVPERRARAVGIAGGGRVDFGHGVGTRPLTKIGTRRVPACGGVSAGVARQQVVEEAPVTRIGSRVPAPTSALSVGASLAPARLTARRRSDCF